MANLTSVEDGAVVFSHCTASLSLTEGPRLVPHLESGRPFAVAAGLPSGTVTIAALDRGYRTMVVHRGTLEESGMMSERRCRVQARVRLEGDLDEFLGRAPGNHHVLMWGDVVRELRRVCFYLGLRFAGPSK